MSRVAPRLGVPMFQQQQTLQHSTMLKPATKPPVILSNSDVRTINEKTLQKLVPGQKLLARPLFEPPQVFDEPDEDEEQESAAAEDLSEELSEHSSPAQAQRVHIEQRTPFVPPLHTPTPAPSPSQEPVGEAVKKPRKPRAPKDPSAPKKPSAWNDFIRDNKDNEEYKAADKTMKMKVMSKLYSEHKERNGIPATVKKAPKATPVKVVEQDSILIPPVGA